jgi:lactate dehydrogenase-like 2-hydroxyacid dehydrogenase
VFPGKPLCSLPKGATVAMIRRMPEKPNVVVAVDLPEHRKAEIEAVCTVNYLPMRGPRADLLAALAPAEGVLISNMVVANDELFDAAPRLRVYAGIGVGYNNADVPSATRHGVVVCNTPGVLTNSVVDQTFGIILMLAKRLRENEEYVRSGSWSRRSTPPPMGIDIAGKTLGVIGFGRIGREVTRRAQAFGMQTLFYDLFDTAVVDSPVSQYAPLDDLLRESDFVTLHTDLNDSTRGLIGERELALMKPTAYLVNTSRGPVVNQKALVHALKANRIAGAGLDVVEVEPPAPEEELLTLPNALVFPHSATATIETRNKMRDLAVRNLLAAMTGQMPATPVNPEALWVRR